MTISREEAHARLDKYAQEPMPEQVVIQVDPAQVTFVLNSFVSALELLASFSINAGADPKVVGEGYAVVREAIQNVTLSLLEGLAEHYELQEELAGAGKE